MSSIQQIMKDARVGMDKGLENSKKEFSSIRTGKASANLLDTVRVEVYGQNMALNQVASVSAPEPRLLTVTPYDKGQAAAIEKAIRDSDLGLNPSSQSGIIRVPLPALNEQRRKELVKILHKLAEEGRVAVRHARTEARDRLKRLEKVPEDDLKHAEKDLQKLHDDFIAKLDDLLKHKEADVMAV
jgi:ribosome recycling factor